jgi:hypothetical protein
VGFCVAGVTVYPVRDADPVNIPVKKAMDDGLRYRDDKLATVNVIRFI